MIQYAPPLASLTDTGGVVWSLGATTQYGKQILRNGSWADALHGQADQLAWDGVKIKAHNTLGQWFTWEPAIPTWAFSAPPGTVQVYTPVRYPVAQKAKIVSLVRPWSFGDTSTLDIWLNFPAQWNGWMRRAIDTAKATGFDTVRVIGSYGWIRSGITAAQYNASWKTVLDYCVAVGVRCYPCGTLLIEPDYMARNITAAEIVTALGGDSIAGSWLNLLAQYPNTVIGVDLVNEFNSWPGKSTEEALYNAWLIYSGAKPKTATPLTFSTFEKMDSCPIMSAGQSYVDFLDFHLYTENYGGLIPTQAQLQSARATFPGKDLVLGEFGDKVSAGPAANTAMFQTCVSLGTTNDTFVRGWGFWTLLDQYPNTDAQYGAFDSNWSARINTINALGLTVPPPITPPSSYTSKIVPSGTGFVVQKMSGATVVDSYQVDSVLITAT